jgi:hypothetical protein
MSSESTFVVNVKTKIGTIITVRGDDYEALQNNVLSAISGGIDKTIGAFEEAIIGSVDTNIAYATAALGATISEPKPVVSAPSAPAPSCKHGTRKHKSGAGSKGPWQAWMCPSAKGTPDQCEPMWIRRGEPGWV